MPSSVQTVVREFLPKFQFPPLGAAQRTRCYSQIFHFLLAICYLLLATLLNQDLSDLSKRSYHLLHKQLYNQ